MKIEKGRENLDYKEIILKSVLVVGIIGVAMVAPNALQVVKFFEKDKGYKERKYALNKKIFVLERNGFIKFVSRGDKKFVTLTSKGRKEIEKYLLNDLEIKRPKRWDKKWRIVSFDIKNTRTPLRNLFRHHLKRLGFVQYQKSIWIHPFECEEVIIMMKSYFKFGKEVMYIVAEHLENDKKLKQEFNLISYT